MNPLVHTRVERGCARIVLDRPAAMNALSLEMVRALSAALLAWRDDPAVDAVVIQSSSARAFCAGGDIRFFYEAGRATPQQGSAAIEDFFTEEYALNHLVHSYPKPYVALMDGVVMGGGMGIAQCASGGRLRIVTERSKMAMPEVNIGLFPDVGASYFLSRTPGRLGRYLALTGLPISGADALVAGLADLFVPQVDMAALHAVIDASDGHGLAAAIRAFAAPLQRAWGETALAPLLPAIDHHFAHHSVAAIMASLMDEASEFASATLAAMRLRSPLMQCVTLELLDRGAKLGIADCLRMERALVRRVFAHGEVIEGVRALVIDKDQAPTWTPATLDAVTPAMVADMFAPVWPDYAHPLRHLD